MRDRRPRFDQGFERGVRQLSPSASDYPPALRRCAIDEGATAVTARGDTAILDRMLVGLFCSVRCPGDIVLKAYDFARAFRCADAAIVGGFQSPMEKECLSFLLRGTVPVILCPARGLERMRIPGEWKKPEAEGRLLLISFFSERIRRATRNIAARRNTCVAELADRLLIVHAEKGGSTERLCRDEIARGKPVFTLESKDNAHLMELGAVPIPAGNPLPRLLA